MSRRPLDLSTLPPDARRVIEQQLSKLPPQARERLLREGSPLVEKMIAKFGGAAPPPLPGTAAVRHAQGAAQHAAANVSAASERAKGVALQLARLAPKGHYNATIRPGDRPGGGRLILVVLMAAILAAAFWR